ncbi:MAG: 4Fe-4S dicluster domain-containing protein [Chloroflexi bacterium]|nr:4Fe-4S dicluster domain-containing protein [Chloroflexota bacterium]
MAVSDRVVLSKDPNAKFLALPKEDLRRFIELLMVDYDVIAPTLSDQVKGQAITFTKLRTFADLAVGFVDSQRPGNYRLQAADDGSYFQYGNPETSLKWFLHPPRLVMWTADVAADGFKIEEEPGPERPLAFFRTTACDWQAAYVLDLIFMRDPVDPHYRKRRESALFVTCTCTRATGTCFCHDMGTGPVPNPGYDINMTETGDSFLLEAGTDKGRAILARLPLQPATPEQLAEAQSAVADVVERTSGRLNTEDLPERLMKGLEHPQWDVMKDWCLGCANCTLVCPTCFCYTTNDRISLDLKKAERERTWDFCFSWTFAAMHGANPRGELRQRYRHWLSHKLGFWVEQYGAFGCVGCGRCITWCPVEIDIAAIASIVRGDGK